MKQNENKYLVIIEPNHFFREGLYQILISKLTIPIMRSYHYTYLEKCKLKHDFPILLIDAHHYILHKEKLHNQLQIADEMKVIIMLDEDDNQAMSSFVHPNIYGMVKKSMDIESFIYALEMVLNNNYYIDPRIMYRWITHYEALLTHDCKKRVVKRPTHLFTDRECDIIELLAKGHKNQEIAEFLNISDKTVKNHISNIFKKMQVNDRIKVVLHAIQNHWVSI